MKRVIGFFIISFVLSIPHFLFADEGKPSLPPPKHGGVYVIAHRGFHQGYPENTLIAYQKAIECDVDFIEVDLRTTADGEIISVHNSKIDDYTDVVKGSISQFTLKELKQIDIGSRVGSEFSDQRIPTFDEILDLCKDKVGLYLDMKSVDPVKVLDKLESYNMKYRVVWYGGRKDLETVKKLCPGCFIMPDPGPEKHLKYVLEMFKPPVIASDFKSCSPTFVEMCHEYGAKVFMDDAGPESWEESLNWGVDGIQTDHPDKLITFLDKRNKKD
ncbi:MAG TPA: glycerophosphodiester phosphodiesterase family protein [Candidatus Hydrogenedens sp.]|nr:glycerophosphodiester phosphodiesterase family protein [Candidatus Hydrogenedens sp.]HOL19608.1 glycerophosphodiester phosphodiesterase family protein [Candidatus Hydrogenedens sp.]HPP59352.1 glycerophosphodiester phosphodiesterase family protein [Candidatus Hydrogenedens sp.]